MATNDLQTVFELRAHYLAGLASLHKIEAHLQNHPSLPNQACKALCQAKFRSEVATTNSALEATLLVIDAIDQIDSVYHTAVTTQLTDLKVWRPATYNESAQDSHDDPALVMIHKLFYAYTGDQLLHWIDQENLIAEANDRLYESLMAIRRIVTWRDRSEATVRMALKIYREIRPFDQEINDVAREANMVLRMVVSKIMVLKYFEFCDRPGSFKEYYDKTRVEMTH